MIVEVVRTLAGEVEWVFMGMCPDALQPYVHEFHPGVAIADYPNRLAALDLDLALAPLEDNLFNRCKTNLRQLEYGACGYPVVCSDIDPFRDSGLPVTLVRNRTDDWLQAIRMHLADPDATANANLAARLPYLFACCRFAHYLKCIVRDKVGSFRERDEMQRWLNDWIMNYVDGDPANSSQETKARKPLAAAEVQVEEVEGNPGYYTSKFFMRPHYQLEGLTVSLRLVSKLPSLKQSAS